MYYDISLEIMGGGGRCCIDFTKTSRMVQSSECITSYNITNVLFVDSKSNKCKIYPAYVFSIDEQSTIEHFRHQNKEFQVHILYFCSLNYKEA